MENIFDQIRPLYEQLHAYVRHKLRLQYGNHIVDEDGPIPMHLVGNMWAQDWENVSMISSTVNELRSKWQEQILQIADATAPYPGKGELDVTDEMVRQNYTALKIFQMGDEFFQSLNMTKLPQYVLFSVAENNKF